MKRNCWTLFLISFLLLSIGCTNKSNNDSSEDTSEYYSEDNGYEDGSVSCNLVF